MNLKFSLEISGCQRSEISEGVVNMNEKNKGFKRPILITSISVILTGVIYLTNKSIVSLVMLIITILCFITILICYITEMRKQKNNNLV